MRRLLELAVLPPGIEKARIRTNEDEKKGEGRSGRGTYDERRRILEMLPHILRHRSQFDTREEVDREPRILGVVRREHVGEIVVQRRIREPFRHFLETHALDNFFKEDLDEDTRRRRRVVFVHLYDVENSPGNSIRRELNQT